MNVADKATESRSGTTTLLIAIALVSVQVVFLIFIAVPVNRLPASLKAIGPALLFSSFAAFLAIPIALAFGVAATFRGGRQRLFGLLGLALTACSGVLGYLAQAANWRQ